MKNIKKIILVLLLLPTVVNATSDVNEVVKLLPDYLQGLTFIWNPGNMTPFQYFNRLGLFVYDLFCVFALIMFVFKLVYALWNYCFKFSNGAPAWQLADLREQLWDPLKGWLILSVGLNIIKLIYHGLQGLQ